MQDLSAAAQNMLLQATTFGLGSLWIGLYPNQRKAIHSLCHLPEHIEPLVLLSFGYSAEKRAPINHFLSEHIYYETYKDI